MNARKIYNSEIEALKISSLPSRPTAPTAFGGKGYTTKEMKEAFDKLPLFIIQRFNSLIDDIERDDDESVTSHLKTGLKDGHSLKQFFGDLKSGNASAYIFIDDESLKDFRLRINSVLTLHADELAAISEALTDPIIYCGTPGERVAAGGVE